MNDKKTIEYINNKNDSLLKYKTFQKDELKNMLDIASKYDYNTLFIGD